MVSSNNGKIFVKVERGRRPNVHLCEESRNARVIIPYDQSTKWPSLCVKMSGGFTIVVQRLEQQYKISVQHVLERKQDICVYVSSLAYEKDIKTSIRDMNTHLSHVGIAGPNLEVNGRIRATKVTFESTVGALHTNAKICARSVTLNAQSIFIKPEAMIACTKLRMTSRRVQIDGRICHLEVEGDGDESRLSVLANASLMHIGVDGAIGTSRLGSERNNRKLTEKVVDTLNIRLTGCLANYGRIASNDHLEIRIDESILSLQDGLIDSASRGYTALKQIRGVTSGLSSNLPTSSTLTQAIIFDEPDAVAQLIEDGVDLNDSIREGTSSEVTPRQVAAKRYKKIQITERRNKLREKITLIQALISTHGWRRGVITSGKVIAKIGRNCLDCAQFRSASLTLMVCGSAKCEPDSIWSSGSVSITVGNDLIIGGQVKHSNLEVACKRNFATTDEAIVSIEQWAKIIASSLCVAGICCVGEQLSLDVQSASFLTESYLEVEFLQGTIAESCIHSGTWQTRNITLTLKENLLTLQGGKVFIEESATVQAEAFDCCGTWKAKEAIQLTLEGSANFLAASKLNANLLRLIVNGQCTVNGQVVVDNLLAYVRNDMICSSDARIIVATGATIATGTYRNDATWNVDGNLHLHTACFEQSDSAIIFVRETFHLVVYDCSEEGMSGRIVANHLLINLRACLRLDGYVRVNQIEICLPYVNQSRCVISGQLEVLEGPLILSGRSAHWDSNKPADVPHEYPAFILKGQLKAEAIIAPFLALMFTSSSYTMLHGMASSNQEAPYRSLISCYALHTIKGSLLDSIANDHFPEAIHCASSWIHEGQIRFRGRSVYVIADCLVNRGRLTSDERFHNHMRDVAMHIGGCLLNDAVLSAETFKINGAGHLYNSNRIYASESINIDLANFKMIDGKLLNATDRNFSIGNDKQFSNDYNIIARRNQSMVSQFWDGPAVTDNSSKTNSQLSKCQNNNDTKSSKLTLSNDIINDQADLVFSARDSVSFTAKLSANQLDVRVGTGYMAQIIVKRSACITVKQLRITGKCTHLTLQIDGTLSCETLLIDQCVRHVRVHGDGHLECAKTLDASSETIVLAVRNVELNELIGQSVKLGNFSDVMNVRSVGDNDGGHRAGTVTINASSCSLEGTVTLSDNANCLLLGGSDQTTVIINGHLYGNGNNELCVQCSTLLIVGSISNFGFFECYSNGEIDLTQNAVVNNVQSIAIESSERIKLSGTMNTVQSLIATSEILKISGQLNGSDGSNFSLFSCHLSVTGSLNGPHSRIEFNSQNMQIFGKLSGPKYVEIDAIRCELSPGSLHCEQLNIGANCAILNGQICVKSLRALVSGVLLLRADLTQCTVYSLKAFAVVALGTTMESTQDIASLILVIEQQNMNGDTENMCSSRSIDTSASSVNIKGPENLQNKYNDHHRTQCSSSLMTVRFNPNISSIRRCTNDQMDVLPDWSLAMDAVDNCLACNWSNNAEILDIALKSMDNLRPVEIHFPTTSKIYAELTAYINDIHSNININDHSNIINNIQSIDISKLLAILHDIDFAADGEQVCKQLDHVDAQQSDQLKSFSCYVLHELFSRFRSCDNSVKRVMMRSRNDSVEDVGYASRSSTDDVDDEKKRPYSDGQLRDSLLLSKGKLSDEDVSDNEGHPICSSSNDDQRYSDRLDDTATSGTSTSYVLCADRLIPIADINFNRLDVVLSRPNATPLRPKPLNIDLVLKRIQMKATISVNELRSFDSQSSLASCEATVRFVPQRLPAFRILQPSPIKQSMIPRSALRKNRTTVAVLNR